jgi:hypothetical protein
MLGEAPLPLKVSGYRRAITRGGKLFRITTLAMGLKRNTVA